MEVNLREIVWNDLWVWFEFAEVPTERQRLYLEQVLDAWYSLGLVGGYNASRLRLHETADEADLSYTVYDMDAGAVLPSLMHNMGEIEYGEWTARCWFDLGTADPLSLDVLINALDTLSEEYVPIARLTLGGAEDAAPWEAVEE